MVHSKMLNSIKIQVVALAVVKPSILYPFYALSQNLILVSSGVRSYSNFVYHQFNHRLTSCQLHSHHYSIHIFSDFFLIPPPSMSQSLSDPEIILVLLHPSYPRRPLNIASRGSGWRRG